MKAWCVLLVVVCVAGCSAGGEEGGQEGTGQDVEVVTPDAAIAFEQPFVCPYQNTTKAEAWLTCQEELSEEEISSLYDQLLEEHGKKAMKCDPWMGCIFDAFNETDPNHWVPPEAQFETLYNEMGLTPTQIAAHDCLLYGTRGGADVNWSTSDPLGGLTPSSLTMPIGYDVDTWEQLWAAVQEDLGPVIWALLGRTSEDELDPSVQEWTNGQVDVCLNRIHRGYRVPEDRIEFTVQGLTIDPEGTFCERDWPGYPPVGIHVLALDSGLSFRWARDLKDILIDPSKFIGVDAAEAVAVNSTGSPLEPDRETTIIIGTFSDKDPPGYALVYQVEVDCSSVLVDVYSGEVLAEHTTCID